MQKLLKQRALPGLFYPATFTEITWIPEDGEAQSFDVSYTIIHLASKSQPCPAM